MSRDQGYGGIIFIVALAIAIAYVLAFFAPYLGLPPGWEGLQFWAVAIPVFLLVIAALVICMWIGWTMLTTPPPLPLEGEEAGSEAEAEAEGSEKEAG